jgi:hypothetical protein
VQSNSDNERISSLAQALSKIGADEAHPRINVGLTDGNRVSLQNWEIAGDCIVERRQDGSLEYLVSLAQVVIIEFPNPR